MVYLITYDIDTMMGNYIPLYDAIKNIGYSYKHPQESTWFVATMSRLDIDAVIYDLRRFLANTDTIFMVELTRNTLVQGRLTSNFWDWYRKNIG